MTRTGVFMLPTKLAVLCSTTFFPASISPFEVAAQDQLPDPDLPLHLGVLAHDQGTLGLNLPGKGTIDPNGSFKIELAFVNSSPAPRKALISSLAMLVLLARFCCPSGRRHHVLYAKRRMEMLSTRPTRQKFTMVALPP